MQMTDKVTGAGIKRLHAGRWVVLLLIGLSVIAGFNAWLSWKSLVRPIWGFMPPQMAMAQYSPQDRPGDLGGMPVTLPKDFVEFVEYNGDPSFGQRRLGPPPTRTHQSGIRSFGFYLRYPDWATLAEPGARQDFRQAGVATSQWVLFGVTSGEFYPKDGFVDRMANVTRIPLSPYPLDQYERVHSDYPGLHAFGIKGTYPETGQPWRTRDSARDIFVARDRNGHATTYIACNNYPRNASCHQSWSLEHIGIKTEVTAGYPRRMLDHWKELQKGGTAQVLAFRRTGA